MQLKSPFVEVGVPLAALGGHFMLNEHRTALSGMRGTVEIHIGDSLLVEITAVDMDLRRISAWIQEVTARDGAGKPFSFVPTLLAPARLSKEDVEDKKRSRFEGREGGERMGKGHSQGRPPKKAREAEARSGGRREAKPKAPKGSVRGPRAGHGSAAPKRKKR